MKSFPSEKYSRGFLSMLAILLTFFLLLVAIWLWYDLRLASLEKAREGEEHSSSPQSRPTDSSSPLRPKK